MKKYIAILATVLAFAACTKEASVEESETNKNTPTTETNIYSLTVSMEATKTIIAGQTDIRFEKDEEIAIVTTDNSVVTLAAESTGTTVTFKGDIGSKTIATGAHVVYPASFMTTADKVVYPTTETPDVTVLPMAGTIAANGSVTLKHLGGLVKITVKDVPAIANTIEFVSDQNITGTYNLGFDGSGNPTLSSGVSQTKKVTFTVTGGEKTIYVPTPAVSGTTLTINVTDGSNTFFSRTKSISYGGRASFLGMKDVWIAPEIYLMSTMNNGASWNDSKKVEMTRTGTSASITLNARANSVWRPIVVFKEGSTYWAYYGYTTKDSNSTSGTFSNITGETNKYSALINAADGNYTLSFDYTTAAYSASANGSLDSFYTGSESMGSMQEMTNLSTYKAYNVRKWQNNIYAYYNQLTESRAHWDLGGGDKYYLFLYDMSTNVLTPQYFTASDKDWTNVWIEYTTDSWTSRTEVEMTNISGTPVWYKDITLSSNAEFYFKGQKGDTWAKSNQERGSVLSISGYTPTVNTTAGNYNYSVAAGTYTFLFCDSGRQLVVLSH